MKDNKQKSDMPYQNTKPPTEVSWGLVASMAGGFFGGTAIVNHEAEKLKFIKWNEIAQKYGEPYLADKQQMQDFWEKTRKIASKSLFSPFNYQLYGEIERCQKIEFELDHALDKFHQNEAVLYYAGSALVAGVAVGVVVHIYNKMNEAKPENQIASNEAINQKLLTEKLEKKKGG